MANAVEEDQVLLHIGDIRKDHNYLGRAEYYPDIDRNILFCPSGNPLRRGVLHVLCARGSREHASTFREQCLTCNSRRVIFIYALRVAVAHEHVLSAS